MVAKERGDRMADASKIAAYVQELHGQLKSNLTSNACWDVSLKLQEVEGGLREHIQVVTDEQIKTVIGKLKRNQALDSSDMNYLRLWIVGDAEHYHALESNYKDWLAELDRLVEEVNQTAPQELTFETAAKLRALIFDAVRTLGDIQYFLKQKERVENFTYATAEINAQERDMLIKLLEGKVKSPDY